MEKVLATDKANISKVTAVVSRITFHNEENGYSVLKVQADKAKDLLTVVGSVMNIATGETIDCEGSWVKDKNYGVQFHAETIVIRPPTTAAGIEKYLASDMVKGIGPGFAKKLVAKFGEDVLDIIEKQPERLFELEGIGKKRQQQIMTAWSEQKVIRNIMIFLQSHGIGSNRACKIYQTYGNNAVEIIRKNPYQLALDINGIGFKLADDLALAIGISHDSIIRARAGLCHMLKLLSEQGNTAIASTDLVDECMILLNINTKDIMQTALVQEVKCGNICEIRKAEKDFCAIKTLYTAELEIAININRIISHPGHTYSTIEQIDIARIEQEYNIKLADNQKKATAIALSEKISIITGGPGVGKTTLVNIILAILKRQCANIMLAAPTGKAAKRMQQTTGMEAKTIHRLLSFSPNNNGFLYDENNRLKADLIIVDECSMLDVKLMASLLKAIPKNCKVILVGDIDQLPSVGPGAALADLISSGKIKTIELTEIFRQAKSSSIIVNAHKVNQGVMLSSQGQTADDDFFLIKGNEAEDIQSKILHVITERIPKKFSFNPITQIQVLAPTNRGSLGVKALNTLLQEKLNPKPLVAIERFGCRLSTGDKVIQLINNYDKEVFNGDSGFIHSIDLENKLLCVDFNNNFVKYDFNDLDEISLAWATTIHKSQGSEYPVVVIPIATQHFTLLQRNLLYTAITRGKSLVVIVGQMKAVAIAINNQSAKRRITFLEHMLENNLTIADMPL